MAEHEELVLIILICSCTSGLDVTINVCPEVPEQHGLCSTCANTSVSRNCARPWLNRLAETSKGMLARRRVEVRLALKAVKRMTTNRHAWLPLCSHTVSLP
ncbi:hypothetical protein BKA64DRAFT_113140 [Cadophora sp. MPI-SDFR-AT-0126]|nr:hypothetical protein BKA64DRAFT_113140 [Leotiomycetes sp. MPI-SDFR-AT-0126]